MFIVCEKYVVVEKGNDKGILRDFNNDGFTHLVATYCNKDLDKLDLIWQFDFRLKPKRFHGFKKVE